jgi:hypothetical protein
MSAAIAAYRDAIRINSEHAATHCNLGIVLQAIKMTTPVPSFETYLRLDPYKPQTADIRTVITQLS